MHAIYEVAHANGLVCGVSDPVWKQLTDTGCCCGILPDDPVFGNWEPESATNQLLLAKQNGHLIGPDDITPAWAHGLLLHTMVNLGPGPKSSWARRHTTWADKLRQVWNSLEAERGPLRYFQGALKPEHRDALGNLHYRYVGLARTYPEQVPFWKVPPGMGPDG